VTTQCRCNLLVLARAWKQSLSLASSEVGQLPQKSTWTGILRGWSKLKDSVTTRLSVQTEGLAAGCLCTHSVQADWKGLRGTQGNTGYRDMSRYPGGRKEDGPRGKAGLFLTLHFSRKKQFWHV
jgi:hypothetical protein